MLRNLTIQNYRCFEDFSVDGLAQVNLIVGNNNSGKTSFLEAIYLLIDISNLLNNKPQINNHKTALFEILNNRKEYFFTIQDSTNYNQMAVKKYLFESIFYRYSKEEKKYILIGSLRDNFIGLSIIDKNSNSLELYYHQSFENSDNKNITKEIQYQYQLINNGDFELMDRKEEIKDYNNPKKHDGFSRNYLESPYFTYFLSNQKSLDVKTIMYLWDEINLTSKEQQVIEALHMIDDNIEKIGFSISKEMILLKIKGQETPIFINSMGEGIYKILTLAILAVTSQNGVLLIDEIETGLHYKAQTDMWRLLIKTAQELNVQIFATTHSWDCICAFQEALQDIEDKSVGKLFRLDNKYGKLRAVEYKADGIYIAVNQGIEVR